MMLNLRRMSIQLSVCCLLLILTSINSYFGVTLSPNLTKAVTWLNSSHLSFHHPFLKLPAMTQKGIIHDKVCIKGCKCTTKTEPLSAFCRMPPLRPRCGQELEVKNSNNYSQTDLRNIQRNQDIVSGKMSPFWKPFLFSRDLKPETAPFTFEWIIPLELWSIREPAYFCWIWDVNKKLCCKS